jgi:hypothetical protein
MILGLNPPKLSKHHVKENETKIRNSSTFFI